MIGKTSQYGANEPVQPAVPDLARDLFKYTLETLRADTTQSRESQQKTIQWFAATFASVFLGGLVFLRPAGQELSGNDSLIVLFLFAMTMPTLATLASIVFLGELRRQGRAAVVYRGLEKWASGVSVTQIRSNDGLLLPTLFGELYQASNPSRGAGRYGVRSYYLSVLALFGGGLVLAVTFACIKLSRWGTLFHLGSIPISVAMILGLFDLAVWITLITPIARSVLRLAGITPKLPEDIWRWINGT
jgi:hypothetical protein